MTIIKGLLKDKLGNQLYPETSFDQVKDDDGKTLKIWTRSRSAPGMRSTARSPPMTACWAPTATSSWKSCPRS